MLRGCCAALCATLLAILPGSALALCEGWSRDDTAMAGAFLLAVAADVYTTERNLAEGGQETNPLLGSRPSRAELRRMAVLGAGVVLGTACLLPRPWRERWQMFWIGTELGIAWRNHRGQVSLRWKIGGP